VGRLMGSREYFILNLLKGNEKFSRTSNKKEKREGKMGEK
jgi:hypothetical protein